MKRFFLIAGLAGLFFIFHPKEVRAQSVVINEFSPKSSPEWVELYNTGSSEISLDGFVIYFHSNTDTYQKRIFCSNHKISGQSFVLIETTGFLNNDGDTIILKQGDDTIDTISYGPGQVLPKLNETQSGKRDPNGSSNWIVSDKPTRDGSVLSFDCPTPTPTPIQSQSSTSSSTSTVKISQPKDQNGREFLGSFKIYIDGSYTGNYAPETYTFGDNRTCGSNNVPCGFGTHTFKVEKTGYIPWTKTAEITSGNNYEFDPVLLLASPANTPTAKPTPTATASATPKSTLANFSTSTESGLLAEDVFSNKSVLGIESADKTPAPAGEDNPVDPKLKVAILLLITAGVSFLASAVYAFIRSKKKKKQDEEKTAEVEENT